MWHSLHNRIKCQHPFCKHTTWMFSRIPSLTPSSFQFLLQTIQLHAIIPRISNYNILAKKSFDDEILSYLSFLVLEINPYPPKCWRSWNFFIPIMCVTHFGAPMNFLKFKLIWSSRNEDMGMCAIAHNGSTRDKTRRFYEVIIYIKFIFIYSCYTIWSS